MELQVSNLSITPHFQADVNSGALQLSPISINEDYCKKWNIHQEDYVCLTKNGNLISNSLYRVGGFGVKVKGGYVAEDGYFMLLKHVEAFYADNITKDVKRKPHLDGRWVILDKNGNEKVEFKDTIDHPYLVKDSCIYSIGSKYYNIETGEFYGYSSKHIDSTEFIFLENGYGNDKSKQGVMKINKKDGTWELFK